MANYKLIANENNDVEVVIKAGSDYVRTVYPSGKCEGLIATAEKVEKSDEFGLGICVNGGELYIAGTLTAGKAKAEKPADDPKAEEKPAKKATAKKTATAAKKTTKK